MGFPRIQYYIIRIILETFIALIISIKLLIQIKKHVISKIYFILRVFAYCDSNI